MKFNNAYKTLGTDLRIVKANQQIQSNLVFFSVTVVDDNLPVFMVLE